MNISVKELMIAMIIIMMITAEASHEGFGHGNNESHEVQLNTNINVMI